MYSYAAHEVKHKEYPNVHPANGERKVQMQHMEKYKGNGGKENAKSVKNNKRIKEGSGSDHRKVRTRTRKGKPQDSGCGAKVFR